MKTGMVVKDNVIVNMVLVDSEFNFEESSLIEHIGNVGGVGWRYVSGEYLHPPTEDVCTITGTNAQSLIIGEKVTGSESGVVGEVFKIISSNQFITLNAGKSFIASETIISDSNIVMEVSPVYVPLIEPELLPITKEEILNRIQILMTQVEAMNG